MGILEMALVKSDALKILVADDSSTIRRFVVNALKRSGPPLKPVEAADGQACLDLLSLGGIDIAFIDVNMPGMSGMEAVTRSRDEGVSTFVVIMSTQTDPEKLQLARKLGAYAYLAKPFSEAQVASIVRNYNRFTQPSSVLLVDDSSAMRSVIRRVLQNSIFNLQIDEIGDGASALATYQLGRHDIVFLDINMPGLSGIDTLMMLKKLNEDVKVVLITTTNNSTIVDTLDERSYTLALYKPFFSADVDRTLHTLFGLRLPTFGDDAPEKIKNATKEAEYI